MFFEKEYITFNELLQKIDKENVFCELLKAYPNEINNVNNYKNVWNELQILEPKQANDENIIVKWVDPRFEDDEGYIDVSVIHLNETLLQHYSIEFTPWDEILGYYVKDEFEFLTKEQFVAHCLWEITFISFDQSDIKNEIDELKKQIEQVENGTAKLISWEDVKKTIKNS